MKEEYSVLYAPQALEDLRDIASYLSITLHAPDSAKTLTRRIRKMVRSLDTFPGRHPLVDWEPWQSMQLRHVPIENFIIFYQVDSGAKTVSILRIVYGGRDLEQILPLNL